MKLLLDMNMSPNWVAHLAQSGLDAVHWIDAGSPTASDTEILAFARKNGLVIITHDLDFGAILAATGGDAPSVIQIRSDNLSIATLAPSLVEVLHRTEKELATGALVTLDASRSRVTLLPIGRA